MERLAIDVKQFGHASQHQDAIRAAFKRGLPEIHPAICSHDGTCVLVGSGPSVSSFVEEIRGEREKGRPIIAVKGAHDFLCSQGITPDIFVSLEPRDRSQRDLKLKNDQTIYLLASRVSPDTFEWLKDCKVMLWHSWSVEEENKALEESGARMLVGGGTTSGMRAIGLFYLLGFRKFVLYGYDSCLSDDGLKRVDGSQAGQTIEVMVGANQRKFVCSMALAQQADDFQRCYQMYPGATFEAKGDGLIAAIIEERRRTGKRT